MSNWIKLGPLVYSLAMYTSKIHTFIHTYVQIFCKITFWAQETSNNYHQKFKIKFFTKVLYLALYKEQGRKKNCINFYSILNLSSTQRIIIRITFYLSSTWFTLPSLFSLNQFLFSLFYNSSLALKYFYLYIYFICLFLGYTIITVSF